ncbi:ubiquitin-related domain-containing protein [Cubamyces lactineus]|nr:ubiquitin-related domain-containing protein [Cubamyces lactineus]
MADVRPSSSSSAPHLSVGPPPTTQLPRPASIENALHARIDAFSPLCPSARTSYTRVDFTGGTGANTPRRDFTGDVDGGDVEDHDDDAAADGAQLAEETIPQTPQVSLTFLLVTGRRRTMSFEPETTIGRVKELVWNAWPNDWQDERPPAPSYLRILYLGKILQDEDSLDKLSFPTHLPSSAPAATIVHLSVRPYAPQSEDTPKKKRRNTGSQAASADGTPEESAGCCSSCIIC